MRTWWGQGTVAMTDPDRRRIPHGIRQCKPPLGKPKYLSMTSTTIKIDTELKDDSTP